MYKLMIVEDEPIIRAGLEQGFDWNGMGFDVKASMEDALDALNFLRTNQIDVILSDIKMPGMDGLEMMRRIREEHTHIEIIFLTGHADFSYVKQALSGRVFEYILKLDLEAEIEPVFVRLKKHLDLRHALNHFKDQAQDILEIMDQEEPVRQAQRYILANFTENLRMEDVAKQFYMSPGHFSRSFKQEIGKSFSEYIKELRLDWAYQMLMNTRLGIQEIGREAGYADPKHFTQIFKEKFGVSPSSLRAKSDKANEKR